MSTQSLDSDIYDYGFILNSTALHEAAISVLVTTIYGRWRTITTLGLDSGQIPPPERLRPTLQLKIKANSWNGFRPPAPPKIKANCSTEN